MCVKIILNYFIECDQNINAIVVLLKVNYTYSNILPRDRTGERLCPSHCLSVKQPRVPRGTRPSGTPSPKNETIQSVNFHWVKTENNIIQTVAKI